MTTSVGATFQREDIGPKYDGMTLNATAPFVQHLIEQSGIQQQAEKETFILDIGTGTAVLPLQLYKLSNKWKILATDFSEPMIKYAQKKIETSNATNAIETKVADAMNLEGVADNSVDYAFANFLYMLIPDALKGLQELHRVLKPGAKGAFTVWKRNGFLPPIANTLEKFGAPVPPTYQAAVSLAEEQKLKTLLETAGFTKIQIALKEAEWSTEDIETTADKLLRYHPGQFPTEERFQEALKYLVEIITEQDKKAHFKLEAQVVIVEK